MKRFLLRLACFGLIQACLACLLWTFGTVCRDDGYVAAIHDKVRLLRDLEGPRLIFAGGSSVAFGINSEVFSERLQYHPINMGVTGAFGLMFNLHLLKEYARPGDVILLLPEYQLLTIWIEAEATGKRELLTEWPGAAQYLEPDGRSWKAYLDRHALASLANWVRDHRRGLFSKSKKKVSSVYARSSFNTHGDLIAHYGLPRSLEESRIEPLKLGSCQAVHEAVDVAIRRLNDFHAFCSQRGIAVFFGYPPCPEQQLRESQHVIRPLQEALASRLTIPILVSPDEMSLPLDDFFDTEGHPNEKGVARRCDLLVNRLLGQGVTVANRSTQGRLR